MDGLSRWYTNVSRRVVADLADKICNLLRPISPYHCFWWDSSADRSKETDFLLGFINLRNIYIPHYARISNVLLTVVGIGMHNSQKTSLHHHRRLYSFVNVVATHGILIIHAREV